MKVGFKWLCDLKLAWTYSYVTFSLIPSAQWSGGISSLGIESSESSIVMFSHVGCSEI